VTKINSKSSPPIFYHLPEAVSLRYIRLNREEKLVELKQRAKNQGRKMV